MLNLQLLNNVATAEKFAQGKVISDGADARMHIILHGEAGILVHSAGRHALGERLSAGDVYGAAALFTGAKTSETLIALTDVVTLPVSTDNASDFFRSEPGIAFELCRELCERLQRGVADSSSYIATADKAAGEKADKTEECDLFPKGHGEYSLFIDNADRTRLMERGITCPLCGQSFTILAVRQSKLVADSTDDDMRQRYKGIEPLYYDVITCPHCLYSALNDLFDTTKKPLPALMDELSAIKAGCGIDFSQGVSTDTVFAGYYLALMCAPYSFPKQHMIIAKLLLKLTRVYQDCGDAELEAATAKKTLDAYLYIYQNMSIPAEQEQQLCLLIAELSYKLGDIRQAKDFFFKVKVNRTAAPLFRRQADIRLFAIRETEKAEPASE